MSNLSWRRSISRPAHEFPLINLKVIEGKIPQDLQGSLYRNGPGRLERNGQLVGHWFDGDGAILGVHLSDGQARATYRYVQSDEYKEEEKAGRFLFRGFGTTAPGPWYKKMFKHTKNAANTSVLRLGDKLLALWEGGWPHSLNPETLETVKLDDLGFIGSNQAFSAHPKVCPKTGEIFNIGINRYSRHFLNLWRCDKNGKMLAHTQFLDRLNMVHDFVITEKHVIVMNFPTKIEGFIPFITGLKSLAEVLKWTPELGTEIFVFSRNDLSLISKFKTDPFYCFHYTNGYDEENGTIYIEFVKYDNYEDIDKWLVELVNTKKPMKQEVTGHLAEMRIDPKQGKVLELKNLGEDSIEFPTVARSVYGSKWRYSMFAMGPKTDNPEERFFSCIARYDRKTQTMQKYHCGKERYVSEPLLVSSENDPEQGYILATVYDAKTDKSELIIHDSRNLEGEPICRIDLPEVVMPGFHGTWYQK